MCIHSNTDLIIIVVVIAILKHLLVAPVYFKLASSQWVHLLSADRGLPIAGACIVDPGARLNNLIVNVILIRLTIQTAIMRRELRQPGVCPTEEILFDELKVESLA